MKKWILAAALIASMTTPAPALDTKDLLALIAMPLAVAEVSNLTGVPAGRLNNALAVLSGANLQPVQFVQVVEYTPVALVYDERNQTDFVYFMTTETSRGVRGDRLFDAVTHYFNDTYSIPRTTWSAPRFTEVYFTRPVLPQMVIRRVEEIRLAPRITTHVVTREAPGHPHGGPPGQVKKELGLQTGAEVVHGYKPGRGHENNGHGRGHEKREEVVRIAPQPSMNPGLPPGQAKKNGGGPPGQMKKGGEGHGGGNGKGHGHGKGGKG
ncbi:MAG TPA: hypothetical protein VHL58_06785 [Thermoanaerobaculia bacterium]|nr:hypothetical protein [Thermoanaerobaculia bacterium]